MFKYKATIFACQEKLSHYSLILCKNYVIRYFRSRVRTPKQAAGYHALRLRYAGLLFCPAKLRTRDNSIYKFQYTMFLKLGSHNK